MCGVKILSLLVYCSFRSRSGLRLPPHAHHVFGVMFFCQLVI